VRAKNLTFYSCKNKEDPIMRESILKNKMILAVDDEPDVLTVLEEEILEACPDCTFHKVTTYKEAVERMISLTYDAVILDVIGVQGINLLELAQSRRFPVGLLITYPLTPETLRLPAQGAARAYLPKERIGEIVPFLEDMLKDHYLPEWKLFFDKIRRFLGNEIEIDWGKKPSLSRQRWILSDVRSHPYS
jgi:CheY-like chemotaxis protein